ncbi:MAG: hypothetical protein AAF215_31540 [Cyanobacteria bacterium P01_A01_bin.123]
MKRRRARQRPNYAQVFADAQKAEKAASEQKSTKTTKATDTKKDDK